MKSCYWVAFYSLLFKEITRFSRIWIQTLVPPVITMTLYFIIFGNLIGSRIGDIGGFSYMAYIVPGLIMMSVITNSYANVSSSFYISKLQRSIEELLIAPIPTYVFIAGYVGGGVARGLSIGLLVTLLSLFFVPFNIAHVGIVIVTVILTSTIFSLGGLINAVCARSFDDINIVPTFVLTPLTYLGGVFYSLSQLSPFWQSVSKFNPIVYMINAFRYGFLGTSDVSIYSAFLVLISLLITLYMTAWYLIKKGIGLRS